MPPPPGGLEDPLCALAGTININTCRVQSTINYTWKYLLAAAVWYDIDQAQWRLSRKASTGKQHHQYRK